MPSPVVIAEPGLTTLLVVDDSVFDHQVIARLLQVVEGLRVIFASGGKEAMQTLDRELPQLILTDLIMPDMDGLELVQQVRHRFPPIPMILMTAFGSEEAAMRALRAGAANYIPKKDLARDLVETVRGILRMSTVDRHRRQLLHCLNCRESAFLLENDPNLIASLLELVQEELDGLGLFDRMGRIRVGIALQEALTNALFHGNLEVSSNLRQEDERLFFQEAYLDAGLNGHAGSSFHLHLNGLVDRLGQLLLGGITHRLGPDVESPFPARGNLPETPDAFPLIVAAIRHVVLANIPFGPPALSVLDLVSTSDQE